MRGITTFQAVLMFALAAAVAVLILASAGGMFPSVKQYGEPLPYVAFRNNSGIEVGVFDYAGYTPKAAFIYVNGRYAGPASSFSRHNNTVGAWTDVYVKCGDWVEVLVQYDGFEKKIEGRVRCSKPLNAPEQTLTMIYDPTAVKFAELRNAMNGYADVTGVPLNVYLKCDYYVYFPIINVYASAAAPDVLLCLGTACSREVLLVREEGGFNSYSISRLFNITVARPITAAATNFFGSVQVPVKIYAEYFYADYGSEEIFSWDVWATVKGKTAYLGSCYYRNEIRYETFSYTEYRVPRANGIYHACWQLEIKVLNLTFYSPVTKFTLIIWKYDKNATVDSFTNQTFGYQLISTTVNNPKLRCPGKSYVVLDSLNGLASVNVKVPLWQVFAEGYLEGGDANLLTEFLIWLRTSSKNTEDFYTTVASTVFWPTEDKSYNIRTVPVNKTGVHQVYELYQDAETHSALYLVGVADPVFLGAALATSVLPPPETPPVITNASSYAATAPNPFGEPFGNFIIKKS